MELEMKQGFKQTEVGLIPEDWRVVKLHKTLDKENLPSGLYKDKNLYGDGSKIIKLGDVFAYDYFQPQFAQRVKISKEESINYQIKIDDLIVALASVKLEGVGKVLLVRNIDEPTVYDHNVALIRLQEGFHASYFAHIFKSGRLRLQVSKNATQVGTTFLKASSLKKFNIPLPPTLAEQKAIATALSDVDDLISSLDALIAKKKAIKQGAMQQLLTPPSKGGKRLDGFEGEWVEKSLGSICTYQNGKALESYFNNTEGFKVISIGNYSESGKYVHNNNYISKINKSEVGKFILNKGELAMLLNDKTPIGTIIGRVLLIEEENEYVFNQRTMRLIPKDSINVNFLYHLINSSFVHNDIFLKAKPGTQIYVNTSDIIELNLNIPETKEEQKAIAQILSDMDKELEELATKKEKYEHIKQGMMQELLTGKTRLV